MTIDFSRFLPPPRSAEAMRRHEAEVAADLAARRREERRKRIETERELSLTDAMYRALVYGDVPLIDTESLTIARRFAVGIGRPTLILNGGTGCGKSLAAAWVVAHAGGLWLSAESACAVFSAFYGAQYDRQQLARGCPLLVLDDVGTELDAQRMEHALVEILEARKSQRKRTIITSNMPKARFEARYPSERLTSRLCEQAWWAGSSGADLRRAGNPKGD